MTRPTETGGFGAYLRELLRHGGRRVPVSVGLIAFLGLSQGAGLALLVPLLDLIGIAPGGRPSGTAVLAGRVLGRIGLPLNLATVLGTFVLLVAAQAFAASLRDATNAEIVHGFSRQLRDELYGSLCRTDWLFFTRVRHSDVTHVLTAGIQRVSGGTQQLLQLAANAFTALVYLATALALSPPLTGLALACAGLLFFGLRSFERQARQTGAAEHRSVKELYAGVTEHLAGVKVAKSFGLEGHHAARFYAASGALAEQLIGFARGRSSFVLRYQVGAAVALGLFVLGGSSFAGLPGRDLIVMAFIFSRLLPMLSQAGQASHHLRNALPSFEAVVALRARFEANREPVGGGAEPLHLRAGLVFDGVSFRYGDGRAEALAGVSFAVPAGTITALVGPSGAGKSTAADLLMGLLVPERGEIRVDGEPLHSGNLGSWRKSVGYVPQEPFLFHESLRENLLWVSPGAREPELWEALRLAAADGFVQRLPEGLDTRVGDRGVRLSGGERQRIALARALLRKPELLLLDEATSSLDSESEALIRQALDGLRGSLTVLLIAHRLSSVRGADRVVVLDAGRVVESGTWDELAEKPEGRLRSLCRAEVGF